MCNCTIALHCLNRDRAHSTNDHVWSKILQNFKKFKNFSRKFFIFKGKIFEIFCELKRYLASWCDIGRVDAIFGELMRYLGILDYSIIKSLFATCCDFVRPLATYGHRNIYILSLLKRKKVATLATLDTRAQIVLRDLCDLLRLIVIEPSTCLVLWNEKKVATIWRLLATSWRPRVDERWIDVSL